MLGAVTPDFLNDLRAVLPEPAFREVAPSYLEEPRGRLTGQAAAVVAPGTVDEVAEVLRRANAARVPVVPYGGGTGLVGGQIALDGPAPLLLSLERMTQVREVDAPDGILTVEAGVTLQDVQEAATEAGWLFPLSIASKGTARIGGILSTNAGGVNVVRYGNARAQCLGIEVVLPSGEVIHGLKKLRKDNTGYDLRDLMIGAEGTLGVITAATLSMAPIPESEATALFAVTDPEAALALLTLARKRAGESVSAFELLSRRGLDFLDETGPKFRDPFEARPDWMVLLELGLSGGQEAEAAMTALFEDAYDVGLVQDGVIAASEAQRQALWYIRENIPVANRRIGAVMSHDISVPVARIPEFIRRGDQAIGGLGNFRVNCFGHMGDGNLHYNIFPPEGEDRHAYDPVRKDVMRAVHDLADSMGGSISAEHGIGRIKTGELERYGDPGKLAVMRAIKSALDPNGIMNPGAVLKQSTN
ncbi:MAG: FAD-binding oxidoreductase [Pseudomonadota bacterium]